MTGEGTTIITPTQVDLERMAEDGPEMVVSDPGRMKELSAIVSQGALEHALAYRDAHPQLDIEGDIQ